MRIALASLMQESNAFNPNATTIEDFEADYLWRGDALLRRARGRDVEIAGCVEVLEERGAQIVPLLAAHACSGGPVAADAFEALVGELLERLRRAGGVDGLVLVLHGAMLVEGEDDPEGEILVRLRSRHPDLPVAVSLDLHAHVTQRMVDHATVIVGYRTYPHVDMRACGRRVTELLFEVLSGALVPTMALVRLPMLVSPVSARTDRGALAALVVEARALERPPVVELSLFPEQPWLDVEDAGVRVLALADGSDEAASHAARSLAARWWGMRDRFAPELTSLEGAVALALGGGAGPVVVGDAGDAPSCGAQGDHPAVLSALLAAGVSERFGDVLVTLCDPPGALAASAAGRGSLVDLRLGNARTPGARDRVPVRGRVLNVRHGVIELTGPGARGMTVDPGLVAVVRIGALALVLTSRPVPEWDLSLFRAMGLEPATADAVFVKSPSHFRAAYEEIAGRIVVADTPGASPCDLRRAPFRRVPRQVVPLDEGGFDAA